MVIKKEKMLLSYIIFGVIVIFIVFRFLPTKGVKNITISQLKHELEDHQNKQFIDVRTPGEFKGYHIPGFKNIPLQQLSTKSTNSIKRERCCGYMSKWDEKPTGE